MDGQNFTTNWSSGSNFSVPEADEEGPPTVSEESTARAFDPITASLIRDTPAPSEILRAVAATPVINPLAVMRGQQSGAEMLPSMILKAQRASAMKERAQLLALLQDSQAHELRKATLQNQRDRLAWDVMKQQAAQGNAAVGAIYKTFADMSGQMAPEAANAWLDQILKGDISQGLPNEAAGRAFALQALQKAGGIQAKGPKAANAPSGFQFTPEGNLQAIPGGPEDVSTIRAQAQARHVTGGGEGGGGGQFAPQILPIVTQDRDPETGAMTTTTTYMAGIKPKGGMPYAVPLPGAPQGEKSKPLSTQEAGRVQGLQQGVALVDDIEQRIFPGGKFSRSVLAGASAARHGVPAVVGGEQGALVHRDILQAIDPYVRSTTGAALNEQELRNAADMFEPGIQDTEQLARRKLGQLRGFLAGDLNLMGMILVPGSEAYRGMQSRSSAGMPGAIAPPAPQIAPPPGPPAVQRLTPSTQQPMSGGIPRISSDADYNALPSGTTFIAPDGTRRKKP